MEFDKTKIMKEGLKVGKQYPVFPCDRHMRVLSPMTFTVTVEYEGFARRDNGVIEHFSPYIGGYLVCKDGIDMPLSHYRKIAPGDKDYNQLELQMKMMGILVLLSEGRVR